MVAATCGHGCLRHSTAAIALSLRRHALQACAVDARTASQARLSPQDMPHCLEQGQHHAHSLGKAVFPEAECFSLEDMYLPSREAAMQVRGMRATQSLSDDGRWGLKGWICTFTPTRTAVPSFPSRSDSACQLCKHSHGSSCSSTYCAAFIVQALTELLDQVRMADFRHHGRQSCCGIKPDHAPHLQTACRHPTAHT